MLEHENSKKVSVEFDPGLKLDQDSVVKEGYVFEKKGKVYVASDVPIELATRLSKSRAFNIKKGK